MKDYDLTFLYHPDKANVVTGALNRYSTASLACLTTQQGQLLKDLEKLGIEVRIRGLGNTLAHLQVQLTLIERIKAVQSNMRSPLL